MLWLLRRGTVDPSGPEGGAEPLLALEGFPGREWAVVRELADRLQLRHHSVVELVDRAQREGLVERAPDPDDARMDAAWPSPTGTARTEAAPPGPGATGGLSPS